MGLDGQINGGWVWVVGYGSGWIEMVMDGSVVGKLVVVDFFFLGDCSHNNFSGGCCSNCCCYG